MLEFKCVFASEIKRIPKKYPEIVWYEMDFRIVINGKLFFSEPNFPVFEFLLSAKKWESMNSVSFEYNSIETEDNPLISFIHNREGYVLHSPWQLFQCDVFFTKEQIISAINSLENSIVVSNYF